MAKRMRLPNGFGQISELKGRRLRNKWRAMVTTGWTMEGKPERKIIGYFHTYNAAYQGLMKYHENPYDYEESIDMLELYERWSADHYRRIKNSKIYEAAWKRCDFLYHIKVKDVRVKHIKAAIEADMPPSMHRIVKLLLNMMLDYAVEYEMIEKNYARITNAYIEGNEANHHKAFLPEEMDDLWKNIAYDMVPIVLIQCYTGFRPAELLAIETKNINFDDWTIVGGMKTKAGKNRIVPVHPRIKPFVEKYYDSQNIKLFDISYISYKRHFTKICNQLGFTKHTPHDARATFVTNMKRVGADEYAIKRIVGHSISDITESIYTTRDLEWLRTELEKMD